MRSPVRCDGIKINAFVTNLFSDWRLLFFALAFFLYALWGSPTPNNPDWVEAAIAALLICAIGWRIALDVFKYNLKQARPKWEWGGKVILLYGMSVPLIIGVMSNHSFAVILRDVIAFIFLCLPLFFTKFVEDNERREKIFLGLCLMIGLFFSVRVLVPHFLLFRNTTELLYLANSPLVLMSALLLGGKSAQALYQKITFRNCLWFLALAGLASIMILAMFVDLQRASFGALVLSIFSLVAIGIVKAPIRVIFPALVFVVGIIIFKDYFTEILSGVEVKTTQVGMNMRLQELQAVWRAVSDSPFHIVFGQGWGAYFASPAVGNLNVTFTHSFLTYIFLKCGLIGLFLSLIYLFFIFEKLVAVYCTNPVKGNALIWSFIIPIFLYASHKSFDFGVLLSLIVISGTMKPQEKAA